MRTQPPATSSYASGILTPRRNLKNRKNWTRKEKRRIRGIEGANLRTLRAFVHWDQRRRPALRGLDDDLSLGLDPMKVTDAPKATFTLDELRRMVAAVDDPYWPRACLRLYAGLRQEEAETCTWDAVDLPGRCIEVLGKGRKIRLAPICDELAHLLQVPEWPRGWSAVGGPRLVRGKPVDGRGQARQSRIQGADFERFLARLGIEKGRRSQHSLRHCFAGIMAATGVRGAIVGTWMGHSVSSVTAEYQEEAARYLATCADWPRGQPQLLRGLGCALRYDRVGGRWKHHHLWRPAVENSQ